MASDVTRDEFEQLTARVDVVEREVDGEKMVTRHILEQTRRNSDDLAAIKTRLGRVETRLDRVETRLGDVSGQVDSVGQEVRGLRTMLEGLVRNLPKIVADAVRSASPRRGGKP